MEFVPLWLWKCDYRVTSGLEAGKLENPPHSLHNVLQIGSNSPDDTWGAIRDCNKRCRHIFGIWILLLFKYIKICNVTKLLAYEIQTPFKWTKKKKHGSLHFSVSSVRNTRFISLSLCWLGFSWPCPPTLPAPRSHLHCSQTILQYKCWIKMR